MKFVTRYFSVVAMMLVLTLFVSATPVAAATPAKVSNVKVTASGTTAKLTWSKASNAAKYEVYQTNAKGTSSKKLATTTKTSVSLKNLREGSTYYFRIRGLDKKSVKGSFSSIATLKVPVTKPAVPKNFKVSSTSSKTVNLKWSKVSGVTGYYLYEYNTTSKTYKKIKTYGASATSAKLTNVTEDVDHKYILKAYKKINGTVYLGDATSEVTAHIQSVATQAKAVRNPRYTVKLNSDQTVTTTTGTSLLLKKNTTFTTTKKLADTVTGYLDNGSQFTILRKYLTYTGLDSSAKNDYSTAVKEYFVNSKGLTSKTNYLIWVSEYKIKINVFKGSKGKWKLVKTLPCVVGDWSTRTAGPNKEIIKKLPTSKYNGAPILYFSPGIGGSYSDPTGCSFHNYTDSKRDVAGSNGCVRTSPANLKYLYDTIPVKTKVYVY